MSKTGWIILGVCLGLVFCLCMGLFLARRLANTLFREKEDDSAITDLTKDFKDLKNAYSADGVYTLKPDELKELEVDWISGSVTIVLTDGDTLEIRETAKVSSASRPAKRATPASSLRRNWS